MLNNKKFKFLKSGLKNLKGVDIFGKRVSGWKGGSSKKHSVILVDNFKTHFSNKAMVINIVKSYKKSCMLALIKYSTGSYSYILAAQGLEPAFFIKTVIRPLNFSLGYKLNFTILLKYLQPHTILFNIEINELKGALYCKAGGTFAELLVVDEFNELALLQLPTGLRIWISCYCFAVVGRASNIFNLSSSLGKAGLNRNLNLRPRVRGVAMNPVDHPHGGRAKSVSPERTPWNKIAKKNR